MDDEIKAEPDRI